MFTLRHLFKNGHVYLNDEYIIFREQLGRNGLFPIYNRADECEYTYTSRWIEKPKISQLDKLPNFTQKDIIENSGGGYNYAWWTLVLDQNLLEEGERKPINLLWQSLMPDEDAQSTDGTLMVENCITGERMHCDKSKFIGILRPEICERDRKSVV